MGQTPPKSPSSGFGTIQQSQVIIHDLAEASYGRRDAISFHAALSIKSMSQEGSIHASSYSNSRQTPHAHSRFNHSQDKLASTACAAYSVLRGRPRFLGVGDKRPTPMNQSVLLSASKSWWEAGFGSQMAGIWPQSGGMRSCSDSPHKNEEERDVDVAVDELRPTPRLESEVAG